MKGIKELVKISKYAGDRVDFTQGGGGNTSVKFDESLMGIKASGFKLKDITKDNGFVPVDYNAIKDYYFSVNPSDGKSHEEESVKIAKEAVRELPGLPALRPSVEVGFHAILKKYVIHTHSVYANLICCNKDGKKEAAKIFKNADFNYIYLPYITPGFTLTLEMQKAIDNESRFPEVIFMQNHGLVVNSDDLKRVTALNTKVNDMIRDFYNLPKNELVDISLTQLSGNRYMSGTRLVTEFLKKNKLSLDAMDMIPLYPDQLVYLNNTIRLTPEKMDIGTEIVYNATLSEATTLEETLAAYLFVVTKLKELGKEISVMSKEDVDFINNWEVEKFRRAAVK